MPKSRAGRLFSRFRKGKKRKEEEVSVNEWVDVDEDYNARSVGKARGDWSSFREEDDEFVDVDYRESDDRRGWNGGAFSLNRLRKGEDAQVEDTYYDESAVYDTDGIVDASPALRIDGDAGTAEQINRELKKLQDFRHPDIDTEVWFVGLGAEQYSHSGINAFLEEHADEMKGAIVINLEALGAGALSCIEHHEPLQSMQAFHVKQCDRYDIQPPNARLPGEEHALSVRKSYKAYKHLPVQCKKVHQHQGPQD